MTATVFLGDVGDPAGSDALATAIDATVVVPLPGRDGTDVGYLDAAMPAFRADDVLRGFVHPAVLVGFGTSGWSATVLALGDRTGGLIVVDGFGPWASVDEMMLERRVALRRRLDDAALLADAPLAGVDPKHRHATRRQESSAVVLDAMGQLRVPTLLVHTRSDLLHESERAELDAAGAVVSSWGHTGATPVQIAAAITDWRSRTF